MTTGKEMITHNPALTGEDIPESWLDAEVLATEIELRTSVYKLLILHGTLVLAFKHPDYPPTSRKFAEEMAASMELILEDCGLEAPKGGWRS